MPKVREAKPYESEILTSIAIRSEAYWGYDYDYIEKFKSIYNVSEDFISNNPTFVIEKYDNIVGFYSILVEKDKTSLEHLFIEPKHIGKGYGKLLWNHIIEKCKTTAIKEFEIVTSPEAKEFYTKMGAIQIGEVESLVKKNRKIPKLIYKI
jgi:GNAT superfamily N-acetyltransferase